MIEKIIGKKIVGAKQTIKAIKGGTAQRVYIANDADKKVIIPVLELCKEYNIQVVHIETMQHLGTMCGIDVGAATACVINE